MMIRIQDHLVGICKIKAVFWLKREMSKNIVISIENCSSEQMPIGKSNWFYPHIPLLIQMEPKLLLMVIQIVLDVLDQLVLAVLNQFHIRRLTILMFVVIPFIKTVNGNKENIPEFIETKKLSWKWEDGWDYQHQFQMLKLDYQIIVD